MDLSTLPLIPTSEPEEDQSIATAYYLITNSQSVSRYFPNLMLVNVYELNKS